jgi:hypothetical protein
MTERLGHSGVTVTTNTYGHLMPGLPEQLTEDLDAVYRGVREGAVQKAETARQRPSRRESLYECGLNVVCPWSSASYPPPGVDAYGLLPVVLRCHYTNRPSALVSWRPIVLS